ncbi:MAG: ABC transporter ATP-binding protein [Clostridia bacterium]|nr:ABC transporter ATP-binding protein [Clostridia bacterium]
METPKRDCRCTLNIKRMEPIQLRVQNLGKAYKRYTHSSGRFLEWFGLGPYHELRWVLRNITFDVFRGEAVGIIGINGAGKSTLLKIIAGIVKQTEGSYETNGRISALLELGTGFHPDFTGRENVYMSGQLKGLTRHELDEKIRDIEAFAEIGDYFDQPLKTYSSGMQVRLAFSVATAIRPEILIVDEALSVGDMYFQHKSFDRIRNFRDQGTTLLFVSHNPAAIKTLCNRALLIDNGLLIKDDAPDATLDYYNAIIAQQKASYEIQQAEQIAGKKVTRSGTQDAYIDHVQILMGSTPVRAFQSGSHITFQVVSVCRNDIEELTAGILIRDRFGNDVFGTNSFHHEKSLYKIKAGQQVIYEFVFPSLRLGRGSYSLTAALHSRDTHVANNYDWWDQTLVFQVLPGNTPYAIGVCDIDVHINVYTYNQSRYEYTNVAHAGGYVR